MIRSNKSIGRTTTKASKISLLGIKGSFKESLFGSQRQNRISNLKNKTK